MSIEKIPIQTLASQLLSTLMQLLFSFEKDVRFVKTVIKTLACQLSCNSCSCLIRTRELKKTSIQTLAFQLLSTRLSTASPSPAMASPTRAPYFTRVCGMGPNWTVFYQQKAPRPASSVLQNVSALRFSSYVNMAESEGAAASVDGEQTSEKMSLKAVVIGGTGAVGRCLLGDLLSSKVVIIFMHLKYRDKKF